MEGLSRCLNSDLVKESEITAFWICMSQAFDWEIILFWIQRRLGSKVWTSLEVQSLGFLKSNHRVGNNTVYDSWAVPHPTPSPAGKSMKLVRGWRQEWEKEGEESKRAVAPQIRTASSSLWEQSDPRGVWGEQVNGSWFSNQGRRSLCPTSHIEVWEDTPEEYPTPPCTASVE